MSDDSPLTHGQFLEFMIDFKAAMEFGFTSLEARMNRRFDQVDRRFELVDQRFEQIDQRFSRLQDWIDERFARVDERLDRLGGAQR